MFTRKTKLIGGAVVATVGIVAVAAVVLWNTVIPHDAPARAMLSDAVASLNNGQSTATDPVAESLAGTWTLAADGQSFVGYRVREELAGFGTFTAVGRTSNITATLTFDGSAITGVQVQADLSTLRSDNPLRDGQLKRQALETITYPTATFVLTQPIELDGVPAEGARVSATAVGDLTLHGVTRSVQIDLEGQLTNGYVAVIGSMEISFADFNIAQPTSSSVLGVADHGTVELQLIFQQASTQGYGPQHSELQRADRARMPDATVEEAVTRTCQALVTGNIGQIFEDMTPEALAKLAAQGGVVMGGPMPTFTSYEIVSRDQDGDDYLYDVRFHGTQSFGFRTRWRQVDDAWKLVDFDGYQVESQ